MRVVAVRHAPGLHDDVCYGASPKPVDRSPEAAADAILGALPVGFRPAVVWTSDLPRCREPAVVLAGRLGIPCREDLRLRELSFGAWVGRRWEALRGDETFERWCERWETEGPPGGESAYALQARVEAWLVTIGEDDALVVTHAGVIRALWALAGESWPTVMQRAVPHLSPISVRD